LTGIYWRLAGLAVAGNAERTALIVRGDISDRGPGQDLNVDWSNPQHRVDLAPTAEDDRLI